MRARSSHRAPPSTSSPTRARNAPSCSSARSSSPDMTDLSGVRALTFDVFGTVVDWRSSVSAEVAAFLSRHGVDADAGMFTDRWRREGYAGGMRLVRDGELPFQTADQLHHRMLKILLEELGIEAEQAEVEELNRAWHRLHPWIDSPGGLQRLRSRFMVSTLSNGNVDLLVNMAKFGALPWDCVLSAQITGAFKPEPQCYQRAAELLGCESHEVMMVAAHQGDLLAAARPGMRTAFVPRPDEAGPHFPGDRPP
ncbi:MAG: haloacid dehalogenase type II, partial [Chloroflexi bacterium]|nr:haloacid dehalogenase type II [Chloroflexota bacterium]